MNINWLLVIGCASVSLATTVIIVVAILSNRGDDDE